VQDADVLIENFRPGAMEGWGLGPEALLALNPRLIMLRISGYGQTGPYRDKPGFGVVAEAMSGLRHLTAEPGRVPVRVGVSIGDTLASLHGVMGILMALHERQRSGLGQVIDVALYEAVFNCMESLLPEYSAFGAVREAAGSALPGIAPSNAYRCADGGYALIAGNGDSIFKRDRKSTRLNSSHITISYAVFCLKKKKYYKSALMSANKRSHQSVLHHDECVLKVSQHG